MYYMGNQTKMIVPVHTNNVDSKCIVNSVIIHSLNYVYSLLVQSQLAIVIEDTCRGFDFGGNSHRTQPWQQTVVFSHRCWPN